MIRRGVEGGRNGRIGVMYDSSTGYDSGNFIAC